jgi:hypothetical protein
VDPVPDPLLLRKSGSAGIRTRISGPVARNSNHQPTEAVRKNTSVLKKSTKWKKKLGNMTEMMQLAYTGEDDDANEII